MLGAKRNADEANIGNVPKEKVCKTDDYFENLIEYLDNTNDDLGEIQLKYPEVISVEGAFGYTSIHYAARFNSISAIRKLLELGSNIEASSENEFTPLHSAVVWGNKEAVQFLLENGANIEALDEKENTPLLLAAGHEVDEFVEVVQALIKKGANIEARNGRDMTPLHLAAELGHLEVVEVLIKNGANIHSHDGCNRTPLHFAAGRRDDEVVRVLVENGADINARDEGDLTPLLFELQEGAMSGEMLEALVDLGADIKAVDADQNTALHLAASNDMLDDVELVLETLIKLGANIEARDKNGNTPLHCAVESRFFEGLEALINLGANIEARDKNGNTPLHSAVIFHKRHYSSIQQMHIMSIPKFLIERGANIEALNINQETPLHLAAESGHVEVVQALVAFGANKEALNVNQETPLHLAAENGHVKAVQALIQLGANKEALDINKQTPLHLAADKGHVKAVQALIQLGAKKKYPIRLSNIELPDEIQCLPDLSNDQKTRKYVEEGGFIGSLIAHGVEFTLPAVVGLTVAISELRRVGKIYLDIKMSDPSNNPFANLILKSMSNPEILTATMFAGGNIPPYLLTQFSNYDAKNNLLDVLAETQLQRKYLDANTMDEANAYYIAEHIFKKTLNLYLKYAAQIPDERAIEARRKAFVDVLVPVILEYKDSFCFPVMPTKLEIKLVARALNALQSEASKRHPNYKQALVNGVVATFRDWIEECQEQLTNPELNQFKKVLKDNCRVIAENVMNRFNDETLGSLDHNTKIRRRNMLCGLVYKKLCSSAHESPLENPEFLTLIEDRVLQAMLGQASSAVSMLKTSVEQAIDNTCNR